jgi:ABC-type uncharacterized transport system involved in gliding motility auxiliary subunit
MSFKAKASFLAAFLLVIVGFVVQFMTGAWLPINSVLLAVAGLALVFGVAVDYRLYWEFFTMRTTKHGINMGGMILLTFTGLVCVNYLSQKHNKTWDLTQEKLNSLSEQSSQILKSLDDDLVVKVLYRPMAGQDERQVDVKQRIKQNLAIYMDNSSRIKIRYVNAYVDQAEALRYLSDQPDRDAVPGMAFVEYKGKRIRIDEPFEESQITAAMIKATRQNESKIYFLSGHGEKDIQSEADPGLRDFAKALGDSSFKVEALSLLEKKEIPTDAAVIAIIGPAVGFLDQELQELRKYLERGGKLLIAADPGQRHNLANLTKPLGVEFQNNYVMTMAPLQNAGPAAILGRSFDSGSDVTKSFLMGETFTLFPVASELKIAPDKQANLEVREIVKSDKNSFTIVDPTKPLTGRPETRQVTVAMSVKKSAVSQVDDATEKTEKTDKTEKTPAFEAVIFGDSDFMTNRGLLIGMNRELALNAVAALADQKDLLSIKPKVAKGSILTLTNAARWTVLISALLLPVVLLISSGVMWFRRRGA